MNGQEALALARFAKAARPQQKWDELTPDAWAALLDDLRYDDARAAVKHLGKTSAYIDIEAIRAEVGRLRKDRLERCPLPVFPGDPDDVLAELAWKRDWTHRIGDGEIPPPDPAPVVKLMPRLEGVFKRPPLRDDPKPTAPPPTLREPEVAFQAELQRKDVP